MSDYLKDNAKVYTFKRKQYLEISEEEIQKAGANSPGPIETIILFANHQWDRGVFIIRIYIV